MEDSAANMAERQIKFILQVRGQLFLWHRPQLFLSFEAKALEPLWHSPQNFPALMSVIFMAVDPFFILKVRAWQSLHLSPASACFVPSRTTFPMGVSHATDLPGCIANTLPAKRTQITAAVTAAARRFIPYLP
jgi:hypothetical protein